MLNDLPRMTKGLEFNLVSGWNVKDIWFMGTKLPKRVDSRNSDEYPCTWQADSGLKFWRVDGRTLAEKIKKTGLPFVVKDSEANWECPQCGCRIYKCDSSDELPGLPSGVKFDPTDVELLDHLAAKCGVVNEKPHEYIDVFIPTIDVHQGICYKHPENLPGARKDGNSFHFFYLTTNAYAKGQRKRRKICNRSSLKNDVRWHKTGKTKAIFKNGDQIGCKKILVLYKTAVGGSKPCKMNWVMHQYHLGTNEEEKDGEYVVSKIFYQAQKQTENTDVDEVLDPRTPMINASDPLGPGKTPLYEDVTGDYVIQSPPQESEYFEQKNLHSFPTVELKDDLNQPACADDYQAIDLNVFCNSFSGQDNMNTHYSRSGSGFSTDNAAGTTRDLSLGTTELANLDLGSPAYVNLAELYFPSEDSFGGWLDRL